MAVVGGISADDADGQILGDKFGYGQKMGHHLKRPSQIVLVQARDDDSFPMIGQILAELEYVAF